MRLVKLDYSRWNGIIWDNNVMREKIKQDAKMRYNKIRWGKFWLIKLYQVILKVVFFLTCSLICLFLLSFPVYL